MKFRVTPNRYAAIRNGAIVHTFSWSLLGQLTKLILSAAYVLFLTRTLGVFGYGQVIAVTSVSLFLYHFSGWGFGTVMIKRTAQGTEKFPVSWGNALIVTIGSGIALSLLAALATSILFPSVAVSALVLLAITDLVMNRLIEVALQACQAKDQLPLSTLVILVQSSAKVAAIITLSLTVASPNIYDWAVYNALVMAPVSFLIMVLVSYLLGAPRTNVSMIRRDMKLGGSFAFGLSAASINSDIDKVLLGKLGSLESTGLYAAASRIIGFTSVPVKSLLFGVTARLFRSGERGLQSAYDYAKKLLMASVIYGLCASTAIYSLAPFAPTVLGNEYAGATVALQILSVLPIIHSFLFVGADLLSVSGLQRQRVLLVVIAAMLNVLLNAMLIPTYDWRGASWATVVSELVLALSVWCLVIVEIRKQGNTESSASSA